MGHWQPLDPRLAADSIFIADGPLSQLRLMDDERFPWLVLVPRIAEVDELIDLDDDSQRQLLAEIRNAGNLLRACVPCDKLNIGALGNIVRQLHIHIIARTDNDAAWPGPVWGAGNRTRHLPQSRNRQLDRLRAALQPDFWRLA
jgi:diadenosine tetraphosphate (Ap4A) HIT family hydrolase